MVNLISFEPGFDSFLALGFEILRFLPGPFATGADLFARSWHNNPNVREIALYSEAGALAAYEIEVSSAIQGLLALRICGPDGRVTAEGPVPRKHLTELLVRRQDQVYLGDASIRNSDDTDDLLVSVDLRNGRREFWIRRVDLAGALVRVGDF